MTTRKLDEQDDVVGFTVLWVRALAARVDHLTVICQEHHPVTLPENVTVHSMGKERGRGRLGQLAAFYRAAWRAVPRCDAIFCHMIQRYAWLIAPLARLHHAPMTLWYTHPKAGLELRLAFALVDRVVTASPTTFPIASDKVIALGHGIDTSLFHPDASIAEASPPRIVLVARLAPIKHHLTMIRAAALLRDRYGIERVQFTAVGNESPQWAGCRDKLRAEIARYGVPVDLKRAVAQKDIPAIYHRASVALNLTPAGSFDKAALEAMLCGKPVLVANPAFDGLLGAHAEALNIRDPEDAGALADRMAALLEAGPDRRAEIGMDLHRAARRAHSLDGLMDRLIKRLG